MQENRGDLITRKNAELAAFLNLVNQNLPSNNVRAIKAVAHRAVLEDLRDALDDLFRNTFDSKFNILTDTTDVITEGLNPDKWFFSEAHFLWRLENQATTDNLDEGTANLYYTQARVDARINALRPTQGAIANPAGSSTVTISALNQSFNLEDTQARAAINSILAALRNANIIS